MLFGKTTRAKAGRGPRAGASGLGARGLMAGFLCRIGGIVTREWNVVGTKQRAKTKGEELSQFLNGLAKLLGESF